MHPFLLADYFNYVSITVNYFTIRPILLTAGVRAHSLAKYIFLNLI